MLKLWLTFICYNGYHENSEIISIEEAIWILLIYVYKWILNGLKHFNHFSSVHCTKELINLLGIFFLLTWNLLFCSVVNLALNFVFYKKGAIIILLFITNRLTSTSLGLCEILLCYLMRNIHNSKDQLPENS